MLTLLPAELTAIDEPEEIATEYLHCRRLFIVWGMRLVDCAVLGMHN